MLCDKAISSATPSLSLSLANLLANYRGAGTGGERDEEGVQTGVRKSNDSLNFSNSLQRQLKEIFNGRREETTIVKLACVEKGTWIVGVFFSPLSFQIFWQDNYTGASMGGEGPTNGGRGGGEGNKKPGLR